MILRYPWWDRLLSLRSRNLPYNQAEKAIEIASAWIEAHAYEAEKDGWQPIHIMKPHTGLAWRWPHYAETVTRSRIMATRFGLFDFVYRANRDGSVDLVTGDPRQKALNTFGIAGEYSA